MRGEKASFIAEIAALDQHRPSFTIQRASKLLASSTWSGSGYQQFYHTPAEILTMLDHADIHAVILDSSPATAPAHQKLLANALASPASDFTTQRTGAAVRDGIATPGSVVVMARKASGTK